MAGTSYTRQSTIADGNLITAALFNNEFNQIVNAFAYSAIGTTGHTHDGSAGQGGAISKIGDQDFKNKIEVSATDNRIEFYSEVGGAPVEQVRIQDGAIVPVTDSDVDLGTTSVRFKDAYVDSVTVTNNIIVAGTVDGRDVATDGTKLDGIEASATADQTDAEIRAAVEAATDSNVFTDADHTKLNAIEASATADQTDAEIRAAVEAATDSNVFTDADHTKLNAIEASADVTDTTNVTAAGALMDSEVTNLAQVKAFDSADYATAAQGTTADAALPKAGGAMTGAITTNSTFDGRDVATDGTKLDGIEASADVTDTANVTTAGALMDSEVTNLAQVKAFDSSDYATAAQGTTADAALPKAGGAMTGAITTNSTFDGRDVATDGTKLDGIEASADVTDTTNVTAAGALMDSEVTNLAQVKAFDSADYATAAQGTTADAALPKTGGAMTGAITTNSTFDGRDVATDGTKLDGIEASADVTDTTNVVASLTAGSNITIAADGTIASTSSGGGETLQETLAIGNTTTTDTKIQFRDTGLYINSSADGQLDIVADTEVQIDATTVDVNGILDVSGNIVAGGTVDGRDVATDGTKLDGIEASADVTDATNVTAAGALMDSELTAIASVKALNQGVATTDSPAFAGGTYTGGLAVAPTSGFATIEVGGVDGAFIDLKSPDSDDYDMRIITSGGSGGQIDVGAAGDLSLRAGGSERVTLLSSGNLGIGTASPAAPLHVQKGSASSSAFPSGDWAAKIFNQTDASTEHGLVVANRWSANASTAFEVGGLLDGGDGFDTFLKVDGSGRVAVGTTSTATGIFTVESGATSTAALALRKNASTGATLSVRNTAGTDSLFTVTTYNGATSLDAYASSGGHSQNLTFRRGSSGETMRCASNGRVGIGTTAPAQALHVTGSIVATGNITAYYSDERLKNLIGTIPNALDKVSQLNGYYYTPNDTAKGLGVESKGVEVGVSAQEIETVLPEVIADSVVGTGYKTVMYEKITPLLIEAIKELTTKVNALETKLNSLEK